jgi:hypothetical protein
MNERRFKRQKKLVAIDQMKISGDVAAKKVNTLISALSAGAAIGSMIVPGLGTLIGSILAGLITGITQEHISKSLLQHSAQSRQDINDQKLPPQAQEGDPP